MRSNVKTKAAVWAIVAGSVAIFAFVAAHSSNADESPVAPAASPAAGEVAPGKTAAAAKKLPEPKDGKRLSKDFPIWIDDKEKTVIIEGQVCLREGMLEMFACTRNTKEHEAIISANTKAYLVHAALVALGAEPGHPARFQPEYSAPTGTEIDVFIRYFDDKGKVQQVKAQEWIKDNHTGKPMDYPFVFGGSSFYTDPDTNKQYYQAEHGDFVCVANFGTAMLDIPAKSSKSNEELEFEAMTKKIPPLGAPVQMVFKPKLKKQGAAAPKGEGGVRKVEGKANNSESAAGKAK